MIDPDRPLLYCTREADVPAGTVIPPGVGRVRCAGCGAGLLATAASRRLVRDGAAQPCCDACLPGHRTLVPAMTAEQVGELSALADPGRN